MRMAVRGRNTSVSGRCPAIFGTENSMEMSEISYPANRNAIFQHSNEIGSKDHSISWRENSIVMFSHSITGTRNANSRKELALSGGRFFP
jgi:hypothetical protein